MENKTNQSYDQADQLKKMFNGINNEQAGEATQKMDVLNLPPRKTVHRHKKKGFKIRFSRSFIRLFSVTIVIISATIIISYYLWKMGLINFISN